MKLALKIVTIGLVLAHSASGFKFFKDKKNKDTETCHTVYDDVWEEKCKTVYRDQCTTDSVRSCQTVQQRDCSVRDEESCSFEMEDKCKVLPIPYCNIVWEKHWVNKPECDTVRERQCKTSPRTICTTLQDRTCTVSNERVCRTEHSKECSASTEKVCRQVPLPLPVYSAGPVYDVSPHYKVTK